MDRERWYVKGDRKPRSSLSGVHVFRHCPNQGTELIIASFLNGLMLLGLPVALVLPEEALT